MGSKEVILPYMTPFRKGYFELPAFKDMSHTEFACYAKMSLYSYPTNRIFEMSASKLASKVGCSEGTAREALIRLEEVGVITKHASGKGRGTANQFSLDCVAIDGEEKPRRGYITYGDGGKSYAIQFIRRSNSSSEEKARYAALKHEWRDLPAWINLSPKAVRLLVWLICNHKPSSRLQEVTNADVRKLLGCKWETADNIIAELLEKGWIAKPMGGEKNVYYLTMKGSGSTLDNKYLYRNWKPTS